MFHFSRTGQADDLWSSAHDHPCQTAKLARIIFVHSLGELETRGLLVLVCVSLQDLEWLSLFARVQQNKSTHFTVFCCEHMSDVEAPPHQR